MKITSLLMMICDILIFALLGDSTTWEDSWKINWDSHHSKTAGNGFALCACPHWHLTWKIISRWIEVLLSFRFQVLEFKLRGKWTIMTVGPFNCGYSPLCKIINILVLHVKQTVDIWKVKEFSWTKMGKSDNGFQPVGG